LELSSLTQIVKKAQTAYNKGDYGEAANLFECAAKEYSTAEYPLIAAEMQNNQCVALLKAGQPSEALETVRGTENVFETAGETKHQAMALANIGAALDDLRRSIDAMQAYNQSAELFKQIGEGELRADVLERISILQIRSGKGIESLITMEAAIDSKDKLSLRDRVLKGLMGKVRRLSGQS